MSCAVVINSCVGYCPVSVPPLLESLETAGVPREAIHVVVGECEQDDDVEEGGVQVHRRRWCNLDNNGLLWLTRDHPKPAPWVVYLHDTSLVAEQFWSECRAVVSDLSAQQPPVSCARLHSPFSMGMGFYSVDWLQSKPVGRCMEALVNLDPHKKEEMKRDLEQLEDTLFKFALSGQGRCETLPNGCEVVERSKTMYGTAVPRIVEYYRCPGVYKIKANWGPEALHTNL